MRLEQPCWVEVLKPGLVGNELALSWREEVWVPDEELEEDEDLDSNGDLDKQ